MGLRLSRHLGRVESLSAGRYTLETASGRPAVSCPLCEKISEVKPSHHIHVGGDVTPIFSCEWCPFLDWISLDAVHETVVPA